MTLAPIAQADTFTLAQGASSTTLTGNLGADNGAGADVDPDGSVLGWVAGSVTSLAGDGDRFLGAFFQGGQLQFLTIQGTVSYPHPVIVTATALTTAEGGRVVLDTSGNFHYTSALGFSGVDSFTYTLVDADFNFTTTTVTLNVTPSEGANDRPLAADDAFTLNEDAPLSGNLLADNGSGPDSDPDGDALTLKAETVFSAAGGLVRIYADGSFTYTPRAGFSGPDSFAYTLLDPQGAQDRGQVSLTVLPVNDAPQAQDDAFTVIHDRAFSGNLLSNDSDADGEALRAVAGQYATAAGGLVTVTEDGSFTYHPPAGFTGPDSFTYRLRDAAGAEDEGRATLQVINRAPVAGTDLYALAYRGTTSGNLLANDNDPDGDAFSALPGQIISDRGSVLTIAADGSFTFTGGDLAYGPEVMTYRVTDALGAVSTGTIRFRIGGHGGYAGSYGDDTWLGSAGRDVAMLGAGDDTADGADGQDILGGGADDDVLKGGLGADRLHGETGKDELFGGGGADVLDGGAGNDRLKGGGGADQFVLNLDPTDTDRIADFTAADRLVFRAADLGLAPGALPDATWLAQSGAPDAGHSRFLYHAASRSLIWDHDGLNATAGQVVVVFEAKVTLTSDSFLLV